MNRIDFATLVAAGRSAAAMAVLDAARWRGKGFRWHKELVEELAEPIRAIVRAAVEAERQRWVDAIAPARRTP